MNKTTEKKPIKEWEYIKGFILLGDIDPEKIVTEKEIDEIDLSLKAGCDHDVRIKFLESNGYEITRENMIKRDLSTRRKQL